MGTEILVGVRDVQQRAPDEREDDRRAGEGKPEGRRDAPHGCHQTAERGADHDAADHAGEVDATHAALELGGYGPLPHARRGRSPDERVRAEHEEDWLLPQRQRNAHRCWDPGHVRSRETLANRTEVEGVHRVLLHYIENECESHGFKVCDAYWEKWIKNDIERGLHRRHKERKFGAGCLDPLRPIGDVAAHAGQVLRLRIEAR